LAEKDIIERSDKVYTQGILRDEFKKIGLEKGMNIMVHSSLSKIGWITGGPVTVIQALQDVITKEGTIIMPAHSGDYSNPEHWSNPPVPEKWIEDIKENMPAFRPEITTTRGVGVIPEIFRKFPGVLRSYHPCFSFSAWGKHAEYITKNHSLDYGLGINSPLGKLYKLKGYVLLIGVNYNRNTSFHLSEILSEKRKEFKNEGPVLIDGKRVWKKFDDIEFKDELFNQIGKGMEKEINVVKGKVGMAEIKLFNQSKSVDYAQKWIIENE
jgi:aminoglycoside 3-N-acetyltransferase